MRRLKALSTCPEVVILLVLIVALGAAILPTTPVAAADISGAVTYHPSGAVVGTYVAASTNVATFTPAVNMTAGSTITLTFPAGTALANIVAGDFSIQQVGGAANAPTVIAFNATARTITFTVAAGSLSGNGMGNATIATSGTAGGNEIRHPTTPTTTGAFTVLTQVGDTGTINSVVFVVGPTGIVTLASSAAQLTADGRSTATLTATVTDAFGNNRPDGTNVTFTTTRGSVGSTTVTKMTTNGVATATLTSSTAAGTATLTATADGVSGTTTVSFVPTGGAGPRASPGGGTGGTQGQIPPEIMLAYMNVHPQRLYAGEPVTITTNVSNTGGCTGQYTVTLMINGQQEATQLVSVGAMSALPVTFTVTKDVPGTYTVTIGSQQATFTVLDAGSTAGSPVSGALIAIIVVGIALIATVVVLIRRRLAY